MSKLKCQVKSKCSNDKTYAGELSAADTSDGGLRGVLTFRQFGHLIFNIDLTFEPISKCSILFEVKKDENFNHRNILHISRTKIFVCRRDRAKGGVLKLAHLDFGI